MPKTLKEIEHNQTIDATKNYHKISLRSINSFKDFSNEKVTFFS